MSRVDQGFGYGGAVGSEVVEDVLDGGGEGFMGLGGEAGSG